MKKQLPPRPDLDHLRKQAKALLAALQAGDRDAIATVREHVPAVKNLTSDKALSESLRLADAQFAVARMSGFASWPQLGRHVEQLRALEGNWSFVSLEVDGEVAPAVAMTWSRILIDGDRFRTESPGANYEGVFNINVEAEPHEIDIEFVEGPEAGNWNYGIFRLNGDQLEICLDMNGKPRPTEFRTAAGTGRAYEVLQRVQRDRPDSVTGGTRSAHPAQPAATDPSEFGFESSETLARLEGDWSAVEVVRDGQVVPSMMLKTTLRSALRNEIKILVGGQLMINALVRINEAADPMEVDYFNKCGIANGTVQHGIIKWIGDDACFCMAAPGQDRPRDFECPAGSGRTVSRWRPKK
ncbi:MAG: TIGR03067 domain-containing protein [Planctomycetota bacterium]